MRSNTFKEVKTTMFVFSLVLACCILFYLIATMFISMGYSKFPKADETYAEIIHKTPTVIIDPGHGGEDPGANIDNLVEKDLNLEISLDLNSYLKLSGFNSSLTREEDKLLYDEYVKGTLKRQDLKHRLNYTKQFENPYFVSIHMNKFPAEYCKGLQTFYSDNNTQSKEMAEYVQQSAKLIQNYNNRKIKNGSNTMFLLENLEIPAILIECGFISNEYEAKLLSTKEYKQALAFSVYYGIAQYLEKINEN